MRESGLCSETFESKKRHLSTFVVRANKVRVECRHANDGSVRVHGRNGTHLRAVLLLFPLSWLLEGYYTYFKLHKQVR